MRSRSFILPALFLLAGISILSVSAAGQGIGDRNRPNEGGSHNVSGKVFLPDGTPAVRVRVALSGADFTNPTTTTNIDGEFIFGSIPAGNYSVTVRAEGYQTENESVTIERFSSPGQGYRVTINLRVPGQAKAASGGSNPLLNGVPKPAVSKFDKGRELMSKNDCKAAIGSFDEAIAAYANFAAAYYEKGACYLKTNDNDKAIESFVKAITIKPDYVEAKYGYGMAEFQKKDYVVAAAAFNDVVQQKKEMAEAHLNLGISLFYLKNLGAAETELKTAVGSKGGESLALGHLYLGQIFSGQKKNAEAVSELEKYVNLAPKAPNVERIRSAIADLKKSTN